MTSICNKHAYLIMADSNFEQLKILVELLDDPRNDIFIHIDQKSSFDNRQENITTNYSNLYFIPRIKVYWGGFSQILCELNLFEFASKQQSYSYYHLLSGKDLPLQTQDYIHDFFKQHQGKEFISFSSPEDTEKTKAYNRVGHYHFFPELSTRSASTSIGVFLIKTFRYTEKILHQFFKIDIFKKYNLKLGYGSNWISIDQKFVDELINQKDTIIKIYKHSVFSDEIFIQTLILNNPELFKKNYTTTPNDYTKSNMRYIYFEDGAGSPNTWTLSDIDKLYSAQNQGFLFARKFDTKIDANIIQTWIQHLKK